MVTSKAVIHIESQATPPIIPVVQGDTGRSILFTLADFTIPTGATATYYIQKPSGNAVYNNAVIEGNTITANLTAQSIAEIGDNYGQVRIAKDGEVVTSFDFILLVKEFRGINATESITEMNIFDKAVQQAETEITTAKDSAIEEVTAAKDSAIEEIAASAENIAEEFSAANSYLAGEFVLYGGKLYKFTANHSGAWTGTDAEQLTVGDALSDAGEQIETNTADITQLKEDYTTILDSAYVTDTVQGEIASFPDGADDMPVKSLTVNIEPVQSGTGDPSPDNVRPISGHTSAKVTRTGVNVWDEEWTNGFFNDSGVYTARADIIGSKNAICVLPNTVYCFKGVASAFVTFWKSKVTIDNAPASEFISRKQMNSTVSTFTTPDNCHYIFFNLPAAYGNTYNHDISINYPATDTDYHEGHVQTAIIDLGGTIYGGTLDVGTGVLTVDRAMMDLGSLNWRYLTSGSGLAPFFYGDVTSNGIKYEGNFGAVTYNLICSVYRATSRNNYVFTDAAICADGEIANQKVTQIQIKDSRYTDATTFKTAMSGVQLAYELATPITVQLTAQQITTLLGTNNVLSDAGDVDVTYRADTKLYIEKLTAPTEDDMIADHAISANMFFMIGNTLYRATTAIASGATITVGTNATKLSLSDALNALS